MPESRSHARVLVVDDTDGNRYAVARLLRNARIDVVEAATGAEALRQAEQVRPDLVVLDINLPDMTGFDVLRILKSNPATASIPVMHLSASYVESSDQVYGLNAGADAYLTHPIDPSVFLATVRALLRISEADAKLRAAVAEQERLRQQAEAARAEAVAANQAKSEFLAVMSHELRTPLNAIAGYVDLLDIGVRGPVTDEQREYLHRIAKSERLLLSVINDILNFARLEAGQVEFRITSFDLIALLSGVGALVESQVQAKGLIYQFGRCAPQLNCLADPERVEQVVINLLTNAVKFTDVGGTVSLHCAVQGECAAVTVADTGRGIPDDKLETIFDPFVQIDRHLTTGASQGAGLGLAISRDLARRMGGNLVAESHDGAGAAFTLTLPLAELPEAERIVGKGSEATAGEQDAQHLQAPPPVQGAPR